MSVDAAKLTEFSQKNEKVVDHVLEILNDPSWKESKKEPEITFYTRSEAGNSFTQVKSVVSIAAPMSTVLDVLRPIETIKPSDPKEKRHGFLERKVVYGPEENADETSIFYIAMEAPGPMISARDFLLFRKHYSRDGKEIYMHCSVTEDSLVPPAKGMVRADMFFQGFICENDPDNANCIRLTFVAHADPCGSLPAWAYNMVVTNQGYAAKGIRKRALELVK